MSDSSAYPPTGDKTYLDRAYALKSPTEACSLYDEWAKSYDQDLSALDYAFPRHAVDAILGNLSVQTKGGKPLTVLDAGCGTGLVGVALDEAVRLQDAGMKLEITGLDISPGMLEVAGKTGVYDSLAQADLTCRLDVPSSSVDVVVCVGTLTRGHVGYSVLAEFVRVTRRGGLIVATVLEEIWEKGGFDKEVERLAGQGRDADGDGDGDEVAEVEVLGVERVGVVAGKKEGGRLVVLRRI